MLKDKKPQTLPASTSIQRWTVRIGTIGALLATVLAVANYSKELVALVSGIIPGKEPAKVSFNWLTADNPEALTKCILLPGDVFKLDDAKQIPLAKNSCLADLKKQVEAGCGSQAAQVLGKSYFLVVQAGKSQLTDIRLLSGSDTYESVRELKPESRIAVCVGFEGRGGSMSRSASVDGFSAIADGKVVKVPVPTRTGTTGLGVSSCGSLTWNYEPLTPPELHAITPPPCNSTPSARHQPQQSPR